MPRLALACALLASALLAVAAARPDAAADLKSLVGKWELVKAELGGNDVTAGLKYADFQIRPGGAYTVKFVGDPDEGTFAVDPAKTPRQMDIKTGKTGPHEGKTVRAIYKLDGDTLTVCYELSGGDRPTAFKTTAGTKQLLAEYRRAK
jgi:uncharacterized protein (TIGR03067 family)